MSQILNKLRDVDPNNSEAIKEALTPFFQQLPKHTDSDCAQWLRSLENVVNRFPKYCMSQRGAIETYLAYFLDCTNYFIVIEAAKCAHALQQVRPSQEKTATPKSCWRDLMNALCNAAHMLIGAMFPNAVDIYGQRSQEPAQVLNSTLNTALSRLSVSTMKNQNNILNKQTLLSTRLRNVFVFIQAMLVEIYPVAKPIRPQTILDVIVRALSVTSSNTGNQDIDDVAMVKTQALRCVDALVACLGPNLIPFSPLVFRFAMQTLKWSSENTSEHSRKVRCVAYNSLNRWLSTLHSHRLAQDRGNCREDELTEHILADITPARHVVELKKSSHSTKHLSKKAKRRLANTMLEESNMASHMPGEKNKVHMSDDQNEEVATAALECAETFLTVCGIFLKPATHKRFQERLVRECFASQKYSRSRTLSLLRSLEATRKGAPPSVPPPTQYCLQLYSVMVNSDHREISNFCSQALLDIRMHLHCSPPSLNFAIEVNAEEESKEEKRKISERNRAALEALLGADKVPKHLQEEEVITVPDEPSSKKRKTQEIYQISVSSASPSVSIEISDDSEGDESVEPEIPVVIETVDNEHIDDVELHIDISVEAVESLTDKEIHETEAQINAAQDVDNEKKIVEENITEGNINTCNEVLDKLTDVTQIEVISNNKQISDDLVDSTQPENEVIMIYEANTQMPQNVSLEDEEETPLSMEVAYDYPNTGQEKATVLEKLEGDNLPSTNETDDIEITCGQDKTSDVDKKSNDGKIEVKVNVLESSEKPLQNGHVSESNVNTDVTGKNVTVEDMLADFVDEVNEDTQVTKVQD